jgi:CheY-like chemotaxis protein
LIITEAFTKSRLKTEIHAVTDGVEALKYVQGEHPYTEVPRPDLILLDLNLPRMNGHEVLATLKDSHDYRSIPIVVLSSSADSEDIRAAYIHYANCYITKPVEFKGFIRAVRSIEQFWFKIGSLPSK